MNILYFLILKNWELKRNKQMNGFIATGDENDYYSYEENEAEMVIQQVYRELGQMRQPLGEATLPGMSDIQNIENVEQQPVDRMCVLVGREHMIQVNRHYFNVIMDPARAFKDLMIQRDRVESILPFNEQVYTLKWISKNNEPVPHHVITFDFKPMELKMVKKNAGIRQYCFCLDEVYNKCLLYKVENEDLDDTYWIVLLKLVKFIPAILRNDLEKKIFDITQVKREIKQSHEDLYDQTGAVGDLERRGDIKEEILLTDLYDIQINNVNLKTYAIDGYKCKRDTNVVIPFYFQIIKTNIRSEGEERTIIGHNYYILTDLYNQNDEQVYKRSIYGNELDTEELDKIMSTEIGNIIYLETQPVKLCTETATIYGMGQMSGVDVVPPDDMEGRRREVRQVLDNISRREIIDDRTRIYKRDEYGKLTWVPNPNKGQKVVTNDGVLNFVNKTHEIREKPNIELRFVITIPYIPEYEEQYPEEYKRCLLTTNEFFTLVYELSLVNGEQLLQLPSLNKGPQGEIMAQANERMPGLETVESFQIRYYNQQLVYEEMMRQQQEQQMQQQEQIYEQQQEQMEVYEQGSEGLDVMPNSQYQGNEGYPMSIEPEPEQQNQPKLPSFMNNPQ